MPAPKRDARELAPPKAESAYRNYLRQCKRLGVTPAPSARKQIKEWTDELAARHEPPAA